jgi:hypothetical protein
METKTPDSSFVNHYQMFATNQVVDEQQSLKMMMMWMYYKNYDDNYNDCVNAPYTTEAQSPKARPLTFKNLMDYCQDFASAVWKQSVLDEHRLYIITTWHS